jgi:hypothetical protein
MPQPRKSGSSRQSAARKPAARKPAAARKTSTTRKPTTARASSAKPAAARKKPAATTTRAKASPAKSSNGRASTARKAAAPRKAATPRKTASQRGGAVPTPPEDVRANLTVLRDRLISSLTLTTDRLQETVDDAVRRGRLTRKDAEELLASLVTAGRQQTEALLADLEHLLGRGSVRTRAADGGDAVLRQVDRARRRVGVGSFPILNYDDLSAAQITRRLGDLTPAQLRKVRDQERRGQNRKSIVGAIEKKLG